MIALPLLSETQSALVELTAVSAAALIATLVFDRKKTSHRAILFSIAFVLAGRYMAWRVTDTVAPLGWTFDFLASWEKIG